LLHVLKLVDPGADGDRLSPPKGLAEQPLVQLLLSRQQLQHLLLLLL
jgi:hypothetical protein